jgi:DNA polymerase-3 subunit alpha
MIEALDQLLSLAQGERQREADGQIDLFSGSGAVLKEEQFHYPPLAEYTLAERLASEKELTGMWFSGHPLQRYSLNMEAMGCVSLSEISSSFEEHTESPVYRDGSKVSVGAVISSLKIRNAKSGKQYALFTAEDAPGVMDVLVFEKVLEKCAQIISPGAAVYLEGRISFKEEEAPKIVALEILPLIDNDEFSKRMPAKKADASAESSENPSENREKEGNLERKEEKKPSKLYIRLTSDTEKNKRIEALISIFEGTIPCIYYDAVAGKYLDSGKKVSLGNYWLSVLKELAGEENVALR